VPRGPRCSGNLIYRRVAGDIGVATRGEIAKESIFGKLCNAVVNILSKYLGCAKAAPQITLVIAMELRPRHR
jgi:hypothetical protein